MILFFWLESISLKKNNFITKQKKPQMASSPTQTLLIEPSLSPIVTASFSPVLRLFNPLLGDLIGVAMSLQVSVDHIVKETITNMPEDRLYGGNFTVKGLDPDNYPITLQPQATGENSYTSTEMTSTVFSSPDQLVFFTATDERFEIVPNLSATFSFSDKSENDEERLLGSAEIQITYHYNPVGGGSKTFFKPPKGFKSFDKDDKQSPQQSKPKSIPKAHKKRKKSKKRKLVSKPVQPQDLANWPPGYQLVTPPASKSWCF
jgi:hypothetical protein